MPVQVYRKESNNATKVFDVNMTIHVDSMDMDDDAQLEIYLKDLLENGSAHIDVMSIDINEKE